MHGSGQPGDEHRGRHYPQVGRLAQALPTITTPVASTSANARPESGLIVTGLVPGGAATEVAAGVLSLRASRRLRHETGLARDLALIREDVGGGTTLLGLRATATPETAAGYLGHRGRAEPVA